MIPKRIRPYFKTIEEKMDYDCLNVKGDLVCDCGSSEFEIKVEGEIKESLLFRGMQVECTENGEVVVETTCKRCGKKIIILDNQCDGYVNCGNEREEPIEMKVLNCNKCSNSNFSIIVDYQYPCEEDLQYIDEKDKDNAFSWIGISLKCNCCGKKHKNIIDCECNM